MRVESELQELHLIDGNWYRVVFARLDAKDRSSRYCLLAGKSVRAGSYDGYHLRTRYAVTKQQLGAKEIKQLGLPAATHVDEEV